MDKNQISAGLASGHTVQQEKTRVLSTKPFDGGRSSQSMVLGQVGIHVQNNDREPLHSPHMNMNVLQISYLNVRVKTVHL